MTDAELKELDELTEKCIDKRNNKPKQSAKTAWPLSRRSHAADAFGFTSGRRCHNDSWRLYAFRTVRGGVGHALRCTWGAT